MPKTNTESHKDKGLDDILDTILLGIDQDELESDNGWWETSSGAEVGRQKKQELKAAIESYTQQQCLRVRVDVWQTLIQTLDFVVQHGRHETAEQAAAHWKKQANKVLADLETQLTNNPEEESDAV